MPTYRFIRNHDRNIVELLMPMRDAPSIGSSITHEGYTLTRLPSTGFAIDHGPVRNRYPRASDSLPRNLEGCECDPMGRPIVRSRRHELDIMSRYGYIKD